MLQWSTLFSQGIIRMGLTKFETGDLNCVGELGGYPQGKKCRLQPALLAEIVPYRRLKYVFF